MDGPRFDRLLRAIVQAPSRRGVLRLLAGSALGGLLARNLESSQAKKRKKKKVTLCHGGQTITVSKKQKKAHIGHGDTLGACQARCSPNCNQKICGDDGCGSSCGTCEAGQVCAEGRCAARCPGGQKVCGETCITSDRCCTNADCPVSGQICNTTTRLCACPEALPDICGGACLAACSVSNARNPITCGCCIRNFNPSGDNLTNCCSQKDQLIGDIRFCIGQLPGANGQFNEQCATRNCANGTCSACESGEDYCRNGDTCSFTGGAGHCYQAVDGTTRCGIGLTSFSCGLCTRDLDCDQGQGLGHFCALATGPNCVCPQGQTFCARP